MRQSGAFRAPHNGLIQAKRPSVKLRPVDVLENFRRYQFLCLCIIKNAPDDFLRLPIEYDTAQIEYDVQRVNAETSNVST